MDMKKWDLEALCVELRIEIGRARGSRLHDII
jgi:hypothetical protein